MSGSGGFSYARSHTGDRFYNPPAMRRQQQQLMQQQQQQQQLMQRQARTKATPTVEPENRNRTESDGSAPSKPSVRYSPPPPPRPITNSTNLDRFLESITPLVPALYMSKTCMKGWGNLNGDSQPYFNLGDLWESFREWSAYGAGVPVLLNGRDSVKQYYVPYLSGIQLYIDPSKSSSMPRRPGEESDAESSRETSSDISSEYDSDGQPKNVKVVNSWGKQNQVDLNRISLKDDDVEVSNPPGLLVFQYLERETPYCREPLTDKISILSARFPQLYTFNSCDLLPSSWVSVAWYPIYRIPTGPTLRDLETCFLTFHSLSTAIQSVSNIHPQARGLTSRKFHGTIDSSPKLQLPVFGLASYKFRGSMWTSNGLNEHQLASSLYQAADNWLRSLQVDHPDYSFFASHSTSWR